MPPLFVCFPPFWNVATRALETVEGNLGSSQQIGIVDFISSVEIDSLDVSEINLPPKSMLIIFRDIDFPDDVSPTAIGTQHDPGNKYITFVLFS